MARFLAFFKLFHLSLTFFRPEVPLIGDSDAFFERFI